MVLAQLVRHPLRWLLPIQAALLLARLDLLPIWGDEQFTLEVVALPWSQIGSALAADIHPPLYFVLLKAWMTFSMTEPIVWARLFSAVTALGATLALDRLWLPRQLPEPRAWFLALWCLSPLLLLDARMARSYSLQTLLTVLVFAAAVRACERPGVWRSVLLGGSIAALLYTHYLPGIAAGAVAVTVVALRNWRTAVGAALLAAVAYLPWLPVLVDGLGQAASKDVYRLATSALGELALRLGYWFVAFSFGEAHAWITLGCAAVISPSLLWMFFRGAHAPDSAYVRYGLLAASIGLLGTWRWVAFAFTPARLLFLLPAYLLGLACGVKTLRDRYVLAGLLALNVTGAGLYFTQSSFLNLGYLVPYQEFARQIEAQSPASDTLVLVDGVNGDPKPLLASLDRSYPITVARGGGFADRALADLQTGRPAVVWRLGSSRNVSQGLMQPAVTKQLRSDYMLVESKGYLPYSSLQRTLFGLFSSEEAPAAYYVSERWERKDAE